jgi:hypothetical protein
MTAELPECPYYGSVKTGLLGCPLKCLDISPIIYLTRFYLIKANNCGMFSVFINGIFGDFITLVFVNFLQNSKKKQKYADVTK